MSRLLSSKRAQMLYLLCITVVGLILYFKVSSIAMWGWLVFTGMLTVAAGYRTSMRKSRAATPKRKETSR
jgi:hypothetical protein